jgi:hypothetical protein
MTLSFIRSASFSSIPFYKNIVSQAAMSDHPGGNVPVLSESDLDHPFFSVLELSDDDAIARKIRFRQFADSLTQHEKQNVKQQVEGTRYVHITSTT